MIENPPLGGGVTRNELQPQGDAIAKNHDKYTPKAGDLHYASCMSYLEPDAPPYEKLMAGCYVGPDRRQIVHWAIGAVNADENVVLTFPVLYEFDEPVPVDLLEEQCAGPVEIDTTHGPAVALVGRCVVRPLDFFRRFATAEPWGRFLDPAGLISRWRWLCYGR